jgi:hypothetical protein
MVETTGEPGKIGLGRAFAWWFVIGAVVLAISLVARLVFELPLWLEDLLTPGALLLMPLADAMADWPGLLTVTLAAAVNGVVYGVIAVAVVALSNAMRR